MGRVFPDQAKLLDLDMCFFLLGGIFSFSVDPWPNLPCMHSRALTTMHHCITLGGNRDIGTTHYTASDIFNVSILFLGTPWMVGVPPVGGDHVQPL